MNKVKINHEIELVENMQVGKAIKHKDGRKVYVESGQFLSGGRVSNFWYWREIFDNGNLGELEHGYGWSNNKTVKL